MATGRAQGVGQWAAAGAAVVVVGAAVLWPAAVVVWEAVSSGGSGSGTNPFAVDLPLLARSLGIAGLIGALATVVALPAAWVMRGARGAWFAVLMAPMLLPSYLAYIGWGVLRSPDMAIGHWLMMGPSGAGGVGGNWYPVVAGRVLAVGGLVLWSWPLAAVVIAVRLRRVDGAVFEALKVDTRGRARRAWEVVKLCRGAMGAAAGLVALVMLGSAIPLHLEQLNTYAIKTWKTLSEVPRTEHWRVWTEAWPLMVIAAAGAAVVTRRLLGSDSEEMPSKARSAGWGSCGLTGLVWCASVVAPVALLALGVRQWRSVHMFWQVSGEPMVHGLTVAAVVGLVVALLSAWMWSALSGRGLERRLAAGGGAALMMAGLMPGVLVGVAISHAWSAPAWAAWVGESLLIVVLGHIARFGLIAVVAGWWLAATESRVLRDMRELDAGRSVWGWVRVALTPQVGVVAAAGLAAGLLSFQEIELATMVQPPSGSGGAFAWLMLQWLHFQRMDDLAAGVIWVVGIGAVGMAALAAAVGVARRGLGVAQR